MDLKSTVILGLIQGLTEFLPVSSSGHLVIFQKLIPGFEQPGVSFDVVLHFGTFFAVVVYFRKQIIKINRSYLLFLLIATLPAGVIGFLFQDFFESIFLSKNLVGFALMTTAIMNFLTDKAKKGSTLIDYTKAFIIGFAQAVAIIPGISRSGATIFAGTRMGVDRKKSAEFSFLLSLPAVLGASILELIKYHERLKIDMGFYFIGFLSSFVFGALSIFLALKLLLNKKFKFFAWYCLFVGLLTFFL